MELTPLCHLAIKHGTDKFSKHGYTSVYYDLLAKRVVSKVLEIGIKRGASLRMWEEFFPDASITGIDLKPRNLFHEGRIISFLADQNRAETLVPIAMVRGPFDLIVDDGTHHYEHQIVSIGALLPFLAQGGIYIIEDIKHAPADADNLAKIVRCLPKGFKPELILTNDMVDSGLMVIERC